MEGVIGYTTLFAGNFAPRGWAFCQGQTIALQQNVALFSILGVTYGGDGRTNFKLPDLQGRTIVGAGQGPGLSAYTLGQSSGQESQTMNMNTMPAHMHPVSLVAANPCNSGEAGQSNPSGGAYAMEAGLIAPYAAGADANMAPIQGAIQMAAAGNGMPFNTLRPVLGLNYIICMQGVFPARN